MPPVVVSYRKTMNESNLKARHIQRFSGGCEEKCCFRDLPSGVAAVKL